MQSTSIVEQPINVTMKHVAADPKDPKNMNIVTQDDFRSFVSKHRRVVIDEVEVEIGTSWKITNFAPPKDYKPEEFTVWSFPNRGDWATHTGNYRGNWSPYIPRNLITKYTQPHDTVLDQMSGSGTTLVECKLLNRNGIGVDVNGDAIMVTRDRLNFDYNPLDQTIKSDIRTYVGDARNLDQIQDETVDLVATHPPYAGIIGYTGKRIPEDLSRFKLPQFVDAMRQVAAESYRVLRPNHYVAILIGDTRKGRHYIPINVGVLQAFLSVGFILKEDIIKLQHNMMGTRQKWRGHKYDFYKIAHEHLFILRKPAKDEKTTPLKFSKNWWGPEKQSS